MSHSPDRNKLNYSVGNNNIINKKDENLRQVFAREKNHKLINFHKLVEC